MVAAPVLALLLNLAPASIGALTLTLVGTPAITFLGLIGAASPPCSGAAGCWWRCW